MSELAVGILLLVLVPIHCGLTLYYTHQAQKKYEQNLYNKDMLWEKEASKETAVLTIYFKDNSKLEIIRKAYQIIPGNDWNMQVTAEEAATNFLKRSYEQTYVEYRKDNSIYTYPTSEIDYTEIKLIKG